MKRVVLLIVLLSCVALVARSGQRTRPANPCDDARTQYQLDECFDRQYKEADAALNRAYNELARKVSSTEFLLEADKPKLKEAELSWIKYRDANCAFEVAPLAGASMYHMSQTICLTRMTKARAAELREQLKELESR